VISAISDKYNIGIMALFTGDGQHLQRIAMVKKNKELRINRRKEYKYQDLASKFMHKRAEVFLVAVDPFCGRNLVIFYRELLNLFLTEKNIF
jgi:hypothetical protein